MLVVKITPVLISVHRDKLIGVPSLGDPLCVPHPTGRAHAPRARGPDGGYN